MPPNPFWHVSPPQNSCRMLAQATRTGGANASIRTPKELSHRGNEGLQAAIDVLQPIKQQLPGMSFAGEAFRDRDMTRGSCAGNNSSWAPDAALQHQLSEQVVA